MLSSQCTVSAPVWIAKDSMYFHIDLVFLTALYLHLIYPPVDSESTSGRIYTLQKAETPRRLWIIPENDRLLLRIIEWSAYWCNYIQFIGGVVFKLIPTTCKSDNFLSIIRIIKIKDEFMMVTKHILNAALETL